MTFGLLFAFHFCVSSFWSIWPKSEIFMSWIAFTFYVFAFVIYDFLLLLTSQGKSFELILDKFRVYFKVKIK